MTLVLFPVFEWPEKPAVRRGKVTSMESLNLFAIGVGRSVHIIGKSLLINSRIESVSVFGQIILNLPKSLLFAVGSRLKQRS